MNDYLKQYHALYGIYEDFIGYPFATYAFTAVVGEKAYDDILQNNRGYVTIEEDMAYEYLDWIFEKYFESRINEEPYFDTRGYNFFTRDNVLRIIQNIKRVRDWLKTRPAEGVTKFTKYGLLNKNDFRNDEIIEFYNIFLEILDKLLKKNSECKYFFVLC